MCSAIERTQNIIQIYNKEKKILLKKIFLFLKEKKYFTKKNISIF